MNLTYEQKIYLAQSSTATAEQLEKLANDNVPDVRHCVARHPNCPVKLLEKLANDNDSDVRYWVAWNPKCPEYLKKRLCHSLK